MNAENLTRHVRALLRANRLIGEIRLKHVLAKSGAGAFAGVMGAFGLIMLGLAGFFALEAQLGRVTAAVVVGGANLLLAGILALWAQRVQPSRDLALAQELHKAALDGLMSEVQNLTRPIRRPLEAGLPSAVLPLAGMLLNALRKRGSKAAAANDSQS